MDLRTFMDVELGRFYKEERDLFLLTPVPGYGIRWVCALRNQGEDRYKHLKDISWF